MNVKHSVSILSVLCVVSYTLASVWMWWMYSNVDRIARDIYVAVPVRDEFGIMTDTSISIFQFWSIYHCNQTEQTCELLMMSHQTHKTFIIGVNQIWEDHQHFQASYMEHQQLLFFAEFFCVFTGMAMIIAAYYHRKDRSWIIWTGILFMFMLIWYLIGALSVVNQFYTLYNSTSFPIDTPLILTAITPPNSQCEGNNMCVVTWPTVVVNSLTQILTVSEMEKLGIYEGSYNVALRALCIVNSTVTLLVPLLFILLGLLGEDMKIPKNTVAEQVGLIVGEIAEDDIVSDS